jgi:DNA polymerase IIIc chi subunit
MQSKLKSTCEELGIILTAPEKRDRNSVTFDMLVDLAEKYRLASPESLVEVIKLMEANGKNSIEKIGNKFLQIKFDKIDKTLYDKLNSVIEEQPKTKKVRII